MKVLLDTNVLASAVATRGLCADVLREVLAKHELLICPQILAELRRVLRTKFKVPRDSIADILALLQQDTICCRPASLPVIKLKDKDDLGILAAAQCGDAEFVVTGDRELQDIGRFLGIRILSPRQFWRLLTT